MSSTLHLGVFGGCGVGKSASVIRFIHNIFVPEYDTTIEELYIKRCLVDDENCVVDVADLAGEEEFVVMREQQMRSVKGCIMVYSITSRSSLDELCGIREQILNLRNLDYVPMVIIGNKCDLEMNRQVSFEEGQELATLFQCPFFETSTKEGINIEEAYFELIREIRNFNELQLVK